MALSKIKLCWTRKSVEADWHLGVIGFTVQTRSSGHRAHGFVISLSGVLLWLAGLAVAAYFIGAAALWFWLDRRPYNYVRYTDLIVPTHWSSIQPLRGQALVAEGLDDIKARKWGSGLQKLKAGIARNPGEIKGRLMLAEIYVAMKARKQAIEIYDGGLATRYPGRDYVETMVKSAAQGENFDWWLRTCDRALALIKGNPAYAADRRWLIQQKLTALLAADRAAEALALAEAEGEWGSTQISEFRGLALLKEKKTAEALAFLNAWQNRMGAGEFQQIVRLKVRAYRESGDYAAMEQALEELRSMSPTDPRPYVYGIVQRVMAGRRAEANASLDSFLYRFGSTEQYLILLAAPLAEIAEQPLLEKLLDYATQQGFNPEPYRRFLVQALIQKGDWTGASEVLALILNAPKKTEAAGAWYDIMGAQIQAALDPSEAVQSNLVNLIRGRQFALSFYKDAVANMRRAKRPGTARDIITYAQGVYPQNADLETWRKELDGELAATAAQAAATAAAQEAAKPLIVLPPRPQPATVTKPAAAVTTSVPAVPRFELTEAGYAARLGELTQAGNYAGALDYLREARAGKPEWLAARHVEMMKDELRFSGRAGDLVSLRAAARLYINGDRARSAGAVEIARELQAAKKTEEAIFLLNELLAKVPDFPVAKRLISEWTPKPAPGTSAAPATRAQ